MNHMARFRWGIAGLAVALVVTVVVAIVWVVGACRFHAKPLPVHKLPTPTSRCGELDAALSRIEASNFRQLTALACSENWWQDESDITVFAPTDHAIEVLQYDLPSWLRFPLASSDDGALHAFVESHIVHGRMERENFWDGQALVTEYGSGLKLFRYPDDSPTIAVGGWALLGNETIFDHGIVYSVDSVLPLPSSLR